MHIERLYQATFNETINMRRFRRAEFGKILASFDGDQSAKTTTSCAVERYPRWILLLFLITEPFA